MKKQFKFPGELHPPAVSSSIVQTKFALVGIQTKKGLTKDGHYVESAGIRLGSKHDHNRTKKHMTGIGSE
jgi:hypothetical protein